MRAGQLRNRVTIQQPVRITNVIGESEITWQDVREIWCNITPQSAREQLRNNQPDHTITHIVKCRYTPELQPDRRLVFKDRILNISSVINVDELGAEAQLVCNEMGASGE
jgi:SPP1 family predicted phage head-tail adaptor